MSNRPLMLMSGEYSFFTFRYLLTAAKVSLDAVKLIEAVESADTGIPEKLISGRNYHYATALVLSAFAVEAAINHVGVDHVPNWNDIEKCLGDWKARTDFLACLFKKKIEYGKNPAQTVKRLFAFRNNLAHGKTWISEEAYIDDGNSTNDSFPKWLTSWLNKKDATKGFQAAESFIEKLFEIAGYPAHEVYSFGRGHFGTADEDSKPQEAKWRKK